MHDYKLPVRSIAKIPAHPRDHAKLLVYDTVNDTIKIDLFLNSDKYLGKDSFLVLNETKVLPARIVVKKETGGKAELLLFINEKTKNGLIRGYCDRKLSVGQKLFIARGFTFTVTAQDKNIFSFRPSFPVSSLEKILVEYGRTPIPKYIHGSPLSERKLRSSYQSVFARSPGSIAAPTASLHFTQRVFLKLEKKRIKTIPLVLHVGLGTFAPVNEEHILAGKLHNEYFDVPTSSVNLISEMKHDGKKLVAVGTTVCRALESFALGKTNKTDLFILPPFNFLMTDGLITNFHLPNSSLMMLVDAFLKYKKARRAILELYKFALRNKFRFYSFGDAMLII